MPVKLSCVRRSDWHHPSPTINMVAQPFANCLLLAAFCFLASAFCLSLLLYANFNLLSAFCRLR
jgi:hypothetical protein